MSLLRLYPSQLGPALAQWDAGPKLAPGLHGFAFVQNTETASEWTQVRAIAAQGRSMGFEILLGQRVCNIMLSPADWMNPAIWEKKTATLKRLIDAGEQGAHLDIEAYQLTSGGKTPTESVLASIGATVAQFRAVIAPFLEQVARLDRVCIYPCAMNSELVLAIAEVCEGKTFELWQESFRFTELAFRDPHAAEHYGLQLAEDRAALLRKWPHAIVREGVYDTYLRRAGVEVRERWRDALGPHEPWVFLLHQHAGETELGSEAWYSGTGILSSNDPAHVWAFASSGSNALARLSNLAFTFRHVTPPPRTDAVSLRGRRIAATRHGVFAERPKSNVAPMTLVFDGVIPTTGALPVLGESQSNTDSWCIVANDGVLSLRWRGPFGTQQLAPIGAFSDGRLCVRRDGQGAFTIAASNRLEDGTFVLSWTKTLTPSPLPRPGNGYAYIGAAAPNGAAAPMAPPWTAPWLVVGAVEWFDRAVSDAEITQIVKNAYPRG